MAVRITAVAPGSLAEQIGVRPGQQLVEMNGQPVRDAIDYLFYLHDENIRLVVRDQDGGTKVLPIHKSYPQDLGLHLTQIRPRSCRNRCIFCFVDQLPPGMRRSLYVKDEDYRLSFLHGNYITLTGLRPGEMERIVQQRLSPLYISVHSTTETIRRRLLGRDDAPDILESLSRLAQGGIQMHCQLVICPGINDGPALRRSVADLSRFFPAVKSVAIVPVGLTAYRQGLTRLRTMGASLSRSLIEEMAQWQMRFRRRWECGFVYLADEIFLRAGRHMPRDQYYDDYPQLENGVGMVRKFLDLFGRRQKRFPHRLSHFRSITLITGQAAAPLMRQTIMPRLSRISNLTARLVVVPNRFFGRCVTVNGLLTGSDIFSALVRHKARGAVLLPPNCLNDEGLFLDDLRLTDLEERLNISVRCASRDDPIRSLEEVWR